MTVRRELQRLIDEALGDDPKRALIAARRLGDDHVPWIEARAVARARHEGWNWAQIGRLLGRTRQSVRARHQHTVPGGPPGPGGRDPVRDWEHLQGDLRRMREFAEDEAVGW